jgi:hypothetical protein
MDNVKATWWWRASRPSAPAAVEGSARRIGTSAEGCFASQSYRGCGTVSTKRSRAPISSLSTIMTKL